MITRTHNAYHLGDNLVHLHFLRKVALDNPDRQFIHYADWRYLQTKSMYRVTDIIEDVPNIKLEPIGYTLPSDAIDSWRGANGFWYSHPDRLDFVKFHVEAWFPHLCDRMNVRNPIRTGTDMLFDYPAIKQSIRWPVPFDVLVINSIPSSGQFSGYNENALADLASVLVARGNKVYLTQKLPPQYIQRSSMQDSEFSVSKAGYLSLYCHTILMVSTGPSWPTFNIWNQESVKNRIILLDSERVNLAPNTMHCSRIEEAEEILKGAGLL